MNYLSLMIKLRSLIKMLNYYLKSCLKVISFCIIFLILSVDSLRVSLCLLTCFSEGQGVNDLQCHSWAWWAMWLSKPEMDNQQLGLKENRNVARSSLVVPQSCLTLCNPMNYSTLGFPVFHYFLEFAQTHVHWADDAIQPSSVTPFSSCPQSFPASGSFPVSQLFTSGGHSIGAPVSASVLPMTIQDWFPLGWTRIRGSCKPFSRFFNLLE